MKKEQTIPSEELRQMEDFIIQKCQCHKLKKAKDI